MTARALQWQHPSGRPAPAEPPSSAGRRGAEVPGYTGYIPGKVPEMDLLGKTFAAANNHAEKNDRGATGALGNTVTPRGGPPPVRQTPRGGAMIPGYTGYIPGKIPECDVFGKTFADANDHVAMGPKSKAPVETPRHADLETARSRVPGAAQAMVSVPGYKGHIPAKKCENVIGATFTKANLKAAEEFHACTYLGDKEGKHIWRRTSAPGVESRRASGASPGIAVPGYSGHVPGKLGEANVMGMTFAQANQFADKMHKYGRGRIPRSDRPSTAPSATSRASTRASGQSGSKVAGTASLKSSQSGTVSRGSGRHH